MENINFHLLGFDIEMTNMFACVALPASLSMGLIRALRWWSATRGPWGVPLEGQGPEDDPEEAHNQRGEQADSKQPVQPRWGGGQPEPTQGNLRWKYVFGQNWNICRFYLLRIGWFFWLPACWEGGSRFARESWWPTSAAWEKFKDFLGVSMGT